MIIEVHNQNWRSSLKKWELPLLWLAVTISFALLRSTTILTWDDSPQLSDFLYEPTSQIIDDNPRTLDRALIAAFSMVTSSGYRPLSMIIREFGLVFFAYTSLPPFIWFSIVGMIIGAMSVSFVLVARHFLTLKFSSYYALIIFIFSSPIITGGWVTFAGIQAIVPLCICLGLLLYWKIISSQQNLNLFVFILCVVLFIGPWLREFTGILPILIIIQEFQRTGKLTKLTLLSIVFFLHAVFPTALTHILFPTLPLQPVFSLGLLGTQISNSNIQSTSFLEKITALKWEVPFDFVSLFPPLLLAPLLIAFVVALRPKWMLIWFIGNCDHFVVGHQRSTSQYSISGCYSLRYICHCFDTSKASSARLLQEQVCYRKY
jgi:hypothetical protein